MKTINESKLESDLGYRFEYLTEFVGFGPDDVATIHAAAGALAPLVPGVQMNALMGFVADALTATILGLGLDRAAEARTLRAFNKLLWLQNDLITRHYAL